MEIGTFAFIKNLENKILLVKDVSRQKLWTLPGGALEFKELLPDALRREVKEETSLDIEVGKLLGIFSQVKTPGIVILFESKIISGIPTPDGIETSACNFFSWEDLISMRDQIKPAQLSMIYQVLQEVEFPIFNNFLTPPEN